MAFYHTCPLCGCNLDPGERCDCESEAAERERLFMENTRMNPITGQMSFNWDGKESKNEVETTNQHRSSHGTISSFRSGSRKRLCG